MGDRHHATQTPRTDCARRHQRRRPISSDRWPGRARVLTGRPSAGRREHDTGCSRRRMTRACAPAARSCRHRSLCRTTLAGALPPTGGRTCQQCLVAAKAPSSPPESSWRGRQPVGPSGRRARVGAAARRRCCRRVPPRRGRRAVRADSATETTEPPLLTSGRRA